MKEIELTILIPALNEEKTIEIVIKKAKQYIENNKINAEIIVINNGSTDKTKEIAIRNGAKVIDILEKGYGNALITGIKKANGKYIIMGDADDSYNFLEIDPFMEKLREGYDIVIGNRFGKRIEKGAMKVLHRYIGTPLLNYIIKRKFNLNIKDVNCGLRAGRTNKLKELECESTGMEFASEMLIKAYKNKLKIAEVPINFYKDKREGKSHLRTIRDGIRHLKQITKEHKLEENEKKEENKKINTFIKYIVIFIITLFICTISLVFVTSLPKGKLVEHCKEAAEIYLEYNGCFPEKLIGRPNTTLDYYADSISLSIIYSLNSNSPLTSVMSAKYYKGNNEFITESFAKLVNGEAEPQTEYIRYWHGYIIILKPLLIFFNIEQIHLIMAIILTILALILIKQLWKIDKKVIFALLIGFYMISITIVTQCFEYIWAFLIALSGAIIALKIDNGNNKKIYQLLFIIGILTCYFDFLTVEILTVLLPIIMILIKRNKEENISNIKTIIKFILISMFVWGIGYMGMYFAKWIIASIVLNKNCINEAIEKGILRISGKVRYVEENKMWIEAIKRNFNNLYPIFFIRKKYILYVLIPITTIIALLIIKYKDEKYKTKNFNYSIGLLIVAIIPYLRYAILPNHSCYHYIFSFRIQLVTIIAFILIVCNALKRKN